MEVGHQKVEAASPQMFDEKHAARPFLLSSLSAQSYFPARRPAVPSRVTVTHTFDQYELTTTRRQPLPALYPAQECFLADVKALILIDKGWKVISPAHHVVPIQTFTWRTHKLNTSSVLRLKLDIVNLAGKVLVLILGQVPGPSGDSENKLSPAELYSEAASLYERQ